MSFSKRAAPLIDDLTPCQYSAAEIKCKKYPYHPAERPDGYIDLSLAENKVTWDLLSEKFSKITIEEEDLPYAESWYGTRELRTKLSAFLNKYFNYNCNADNIVLAAGSGSLMELLFFTICDDEDSVLVLSPYYAGFPKILGYRNHVSMIPVALENGFSDTNGTLKALEEAYDAQPAGKKPKALLFSNPNNPTGRVASEQELEALVKFCKDRNIHCVSDEVYAASVFDPNAKFISATTIAERLGANDLVHCLYGFSKDFGCAGLRCGVLHSKNDSAMWAIQKLIRFCPTSTLVQKAVLALLSDEKFMENYITQYVSRLRTVNQLVTKGLDALGVKYQPSQAGLFLLIDLRHLIKLVEAGTIPKTATVKKTLEDHLYKYIWSETKVHLTPGDLCYLKEEGWFRICSANKEENVQEFLKRLDTFLQRFKQ